MSCSGCPSDQSKVVELKEKIIPKDGMLVVTEKAAEFVGTMMKKQKKNNWGLKLEVIPGGCAGFKYFMGFQENAVEGDLTIESRGLKVFLAEDSVPFIVGSEIDYVESLEAAGLKINNPNATRGCGCGKSFG